MEFDIGRMCRLDGQKPTVKDRWTAFYRLYRLAKKQSFRHEMAAVDCLRILMENWALIRLVDGDGPNPGRGHYPAFLRKMLVENQRRRRIAASEKG